MMNDKIGENFMTYFRSFFCFSFFFYCFFVENLNACLVTDTSFIGKDVPKTYKSLGDYSRHISTFQPLCLVKGGEGAVESRFIADPTLAKTAFVPE
jgi:hypothetical protein